MQPDPPPSSFTHLQAWFQIAETNLALLHVLAAVWFSSSESVTAQGNIFPSAAQNRSTAVPVFAG
jgi:hypothetical protein